MNTVPKSLYELREGDVIARHPDHPEREIAYTVTREPLSLDGILDGRPREMAMDYSTLDGATGRLILPVDATVQVLGPEAKQAIEAAMERAAKLAGIRELADWLEAHSDVPVGDWTITYFPRSELVGDEAMAARTAEVDRIAGLLGVQPRHDTHYFAERQFGGSEYRVIVCDAPQPAETGEGAEQS